jgi:hypothetical protein
MTNPAVNATIASTPVLVQQQCGRINWQKAARRLFSSNTGAGLPQPASFASGSEHASGATGHHTVI